MMHISLLINDASFGKSHMLWVRYYKIGEIFHCLFASFICTKGGNCYPYP